MTNLVAFVTGSSKGIGQAIAERLGVEGYFTYVTYKTDKQGAIQTADRISVQGGKASILYLDVRLEDSVKDAVNKIQKEQGHLNVLVNNAAIEIPGVIEELSYEDWKLVTTTKLDGCFLVTKYALPLLKVAQNANLIFLTAHLGEKPIPASLAYCVGTAGIIALTKMMAIHLGQYGIRTNAISPGPIRTPMWNVLGGDNNALWNDFAKQTPMGRVAKTDDIANTIMMIINDSSGYLNGNFIHADGGRYLNM